MGNSLGAIKCCLLGLRFLVEIGAFGPSFPLSSPPSIKLIIESKKVHLASLNFQACESSYGPVPPPDVQEARHQHLLREPEAVRRRSRIGPGRTFQP